MNLARVSSPPRPANEGQAHLWWICIRMLLIFALALLPMVAGGVLFLKGLHEKANAREAERPAAISPEGGREVAER